MRHEGRGAGAWRPGFLQGAGVRVGKKAQVSRRLGAAEQLRLEQGGLLQLCSFHSLPFMYGAGYLGVHVAMPMALSTCQ